jgi:hypothetical protein
MCKKKRKTSTGQSTMGVGSIYYLASPYLYTGREDKAKMAVFLKIFHAAESDLTVPLTCLQRTLFKTVGSSLDVNATTPSSPNKDEVVSCTPSMSFPMQQSFIILPDFNAIDVCPNATELHYSP